MTSSFFKLDDLPAARYERKFLARDFSLEEVLSILRMHFAGFYRVYPARWVNSIYLDTPSLRHYHVHVSGVPNRYKVRVRWYGDLCGGIQAPRLEFKVKRGLVGGKIVQPLEPFDFEESAPEESLARYLEKTTLPETAADYLKTLSPTLVNRYWRHYLLSADGRFRVTVDTGLEFYKPDRSCSGIFNLNRGLSLPVIIELKYLPVHEPEAQEITNSLPFRLTRCSKYIMGIDRQYGYDY